MSCLLAIGLIVPVFSTSLTTCTLKASECIRFLVLGMFTTVGRLTRGRKGSLAAFVLAPSVRHLFLPVEPTRRHPERVVRELRQILDRIACGVPAQ